MFHDKDPLEPVIQHILDNLENKEKYSPDIIILLQNTSPLRDSTYIDGGYKISIFKRFLPRFFQGSAEILMISS